MVEITINYEGDLHCSATHGPSGSVISTDAPLDNQGRGEAFSPTDLLATSLGTCMSTVMGIAARRKEVALEGLKVTVKKHMSTDAPRRVARLEVDLEMPIAENHPDAAFLKAAGLSCPVHQSLHPDVIQEIRWHWAS